MRQDGALEPGEPVAVLAGLVYAGLYALANFVQVKPRGLGCDPTSVAMSGRARGRAFVGQQRAEAALRCFGPLRIRAASSMSTAPSDSSGEVVFSRNALLFFLFCQILSVDELLV